MLQITIPARELFDDAKQEFIKINEETLQLEHSLLSISKWESKWCKPFLGKDNKTNEELNDYIRCMTINKNVSPDAYRYIPNSIFKKIVEYIGAPMTATTISKQNQKPSKEIITAEIIYYWMLTMNIPMECQKWHLTRLLTLINVTNIKSSPPKKMGKKEMLSQRQLINEARRKQFNTKG